MTLVKFDSNALILPSSKEERKKLVHGHNTKSLLKVNEKSVPSKNVRKKLKQLKTRKEENEKRNSLLKKLKQYTLSKDIASKLRSTASQSRRGYSTTLQNKRYLNTSEVFKDPKENVTDNINANEFEDDSSCSSDLMASPLKQNSCQTEKATVKSQTGFHAKQESISKKTSVSSPCSTRRDDSQFRKPQLVDRPIEVEKRRSLLPALAYEQEIIEAVIENDVLMITGSTGCGKSTQIPQFLFESGFCGKDKTQLVGITQPRRVAVTALASRVAFELNNKSICGYQIRHDSNLTKECCLKFMTDGILLREVQEDFLCSRYSVIVLDEAHERSVNCDILLGLLSRIVLLRRERYNKGNGNLGPLRLIIMSATLCFSDITKNAQLFHVPVPLIEIPSQTHPVTIHFSRTTPTHNYVSAAVDKVIKIHRQLPAGSLLVFMPGRQEVHAVLSQLAERLLEKNTSSFCLPSYCYEKETSTASALCWRGDSDEEPADDEENLSKTNYTQNITDTVVAETIKPNVDNNPFVFEDEESFNTLNQVANETDHKPILSTEHITDIKMAESLGFDSGIGMGTVNPKQSSDEFIKWEGYGSDVSNGIECSVRLVPLYALLPLKEQTKAFEPPKSNERVIIVATNVAETSLTLPNIRYVIDSGRERRLRCSGTDATSVFVIDWISKASADQRCGRGGRIGPGHCYRLYSSAVYTNIFPTYPRVALQNTPLDSVLLFMASLGIPNVDKFPFPSPPSSHNLDCAKTLLYNLGAFQETKGVDPNRQLRITTLGKLMARLPVASRFAFCLIGAMSCATKQTELVPIMCMICAGWSVGQLLLPSAFDSGSIKHEPKWRQFRSDVDATWWLITRFIRASNREEFCKRNYANYKQLTETMNLYNQLLKEMHKHFHLTFDIQTWLDKPHKAYVPSWIKQIHTCLLLGFIDKIAIHHTLLPSYQNRNCKRNVYIWGSAHSASFSNDKASQELQVCVQKTSLVSNLKPLPLCLVFSQAICMDKEASHGCAPKYVLHQCFSVSTTELASVKSPLIQYSNLLMYPLPIYQPHQDCIVGYVKPSYVPLSFKLPVICIPLKEEHGEILFRVFCKAFLQGDVIKKLQTLHTTQQSYLRLEPSWLLYSCDTRCTNQVLSQSSLPPLHKDFLPFIKELQRENCYSRSRLHSIWKKNPLYLKKEYTALISITCPKTLLKNITSSWATNS